MLKKVRKTLYLPAFVAQLLDKEGEIYDGPGVVAARDSGGPADSD
ncbi:MAG TPA: hypothetical protein VMY06_14825 [Sedimentisphaerales bacterium]|nr:hypothetical protein [Sedimentisphaerales bacterium]HUU15586.1 hypothetical protein [Sedimentisphaerales bacterium]